MTQAVSDIEVPVLCVDGPSGSGKGTVSRAVARRLGWHFLDSGALYRAVGVAAGRQGVSLDDPDALASLAERTRVDFRDAGEAEPVVLVDGIDATGELRTEAAGSAASAIAAIPGVRAMLLQRQRDCRQAPGLVADGRDMGTVVFPDAQFKVFLTASPEERARRRHKQLSAKGVEVTLAGLLREIIARDARDAQRAVAPLRPADDAVAVDSTDVSVDAVVERVLSLLPDSFRVSRG